MIDGHPLPGIERNKDDGSGNDKSAGPTGCNQPGNTLQSKGTVLWGGLDEVSQVYPYTAPDYITHGWLGRLARH